MTALEGCSEGISRVTGCRTSHSCFTVCRGVVSTWLGRGVHLVTIVADRMSETISSVDGLSALVRVATSVSNAFATVAEHFPCISTRFERFSQAEFDALVAGTTIFADPAYFLCGDAREDIRKGRYFWVAGKVCSTVVNFERFIVWLHSCGRDSLYNAFESVSRTRALRWTRVVSLTTAIGVLSIGASAFKGIERIRDIQRGDKPILAIVDGCAQVAEVALGVGEMLPFCGPLALAILGVVAAGLGLASYLTDISLKVAKDGDAQSLKV